MGFASSFGTSHLSHLRLEAAYCSSFEGKRVTLTPGFISRAAGVLPYLRLLVLRGFLWKFGSTSLILQLSISQICPTFFKCWEFVCTNVYLPPQGQTLSFPRKPRHQAWHPPNPGDLLHAPPAPSSSSWNPNTFIPKRKADCLPAISPCLCSFYLCRSVFTILVFPIFCSLCRGAFQPLFPAGVQGFLKVG